MEEIVIFGRPGYPGKACGKAVVCPHSIRGWTGIDMKTGCIIEEENEEYGTCIKDSILVLPYGRGSTGWSQYFHSAKIAGFCPAGLLFSTVDSRCGSMNAAIEVPSVADFDERGIDLFSLIQTGDKVEIDGGSGKVVIQKVVAVRD